MAGTTAWSPPEFVGRGEIQAQSDTIFEQGGFPIVERLVVETIDALEMEWEVAASVVEPADSSDVAVGADGKKVGVFLLHGSFGDHREKLASARFLAQHYGYRVVAMSHPGRYNLLDPNGDWPGDTINQDGSVRTPIWHRNDLVRREEYDVVLDRSDPIARAKWGTLYFAAARKGTAFYDRMSSWPAAFEEAMLVLCRKYFPDSEYSIYVHGHSAGGPFAHMLLQRLSNVAGLLGAETSSFAYIFRRAIGMDWKYPFHFLAVNSWRNLAMYRGVEAGEELGRRLPQVMEEVMEEWERVKVKPYFKASYVFNYAAVPQMSAAAEAAADRLRLRQRGRRQLIERYLGYLRELPADGWRRVPPLLLVITSGSRDHTVARYEGVILPMLRSMRPAPVAHLVRLGSGVHSYDRPQEGLPLGVFPAIAAIWSAAIASGYFETSD